LKLSDPRIFKEINFQSGAGVICRDNFYEKKLKNFEIFSKVHLISSVNDFQTRHVIFLLQASGDQVRHMIPSYIGRRMKDEMWSRVTLQNRNQLRSNFKIIFFVEIIIFTK